MPAPWGTIHPESRSGGRAGYAIFTEIGAAREIEQTKRIIARVEEKLDESES